MARPPTAVFVHARVVGPAGDNCRLNFDAVVGQRDLEDSYMPAFQSAVELGAVSGLMCSCECRPEVLLGGRIQSYLKEPPPRNPAMAHSALSLAQTTR